MAWLEIPLDDYPDQEIAVVVSVNSKNIPLILNVRYNEEGEFFRACPVTMNQQSDQNGFGARASNSSRGVMKDDQKARANAGRMGANRGTITGEGHRPGTAGEGHTPNHKRDLVDTLYRCAMERYAGALRSVEECVQSIPRVDESGRVDTSVRSTA